MARADALANLAADGALALVQAIDSTADPTKWLTKPITKQRGGLAQAFMVESKPAICIEVAGFKDALGSAGVHRPLLTIAGHCITEEGMNSEPNLVKLAADFMTAILQDETLGGYVQRMMDDGFSYEPQTELMLQSGLGIATVSATFEAYFDHTTDNPS